MTSTLAPPPVQSEDAANADLTRCKAEDSAHYPGLRMGPAPWLAGPPMTGLYASQIVSVSEVPACVGPKGAFLDEVHYPLFAVNAGPSHPSYGVQRIFHPPMLWGYKG